jgi:Xaa-Pro aminopeptidase
MLVDGNAFSIEPGFYIEGKYGARIEDIVIKNGLKTIVCNNSKKELVFI